MLPLFAGCLPEVRPKPRPRVGTGRKALPRAAGATVTPIAAREKVTRHVSIDDVVVDADLYARVELSKGRVAEFAELIDEDPSRLPPISVICDGARYLVADGAHREAAYRRLGLVQIEVEVIPAADGLTPQEQAFLYGIDSAATGSLPLKMCERKIACDRLHDRYPSMSKQEIADRVGMSREAVSKRLSRNAQANSPQGPAIVPLSLTVAEQVALDIVKSVAHLRELVGGDDGAAAQLLALAFSAHSGDLAGLAGWARDRFGDTAECLAAVGGGIR